MVKCYGDHEENTLKRSNTVRSSSTILMEVLLHYASKQGGNGGGVGEKGKNGIERSRFERRLI